MKVKISAHGRVAIPASIRRELGLKAGYRIDIAVRAGRIVLTPKMKRWKAKIIKDPITGLPVLHTGLGAPVLTSQMVRELLEGFD